MIRRCASAGCGYLVRWHAYCPAHRLEEHPVTEHVHRARAARDYPADAPVALVTTAQQLAYRRPSATACRSSTAARRDRTSLGPGVNVTAARTRRGAKAWRGGRHDVDQRPDLRPVPAQPARPDQLDPNPKENGMNTMHEKNAMRTRIAGEGSGA